MSSVPSASSRWPWLTRRRQLTLLLAAVGAAAVIVWMHRRNERGFLNEFAQALPMSVSLSAGVLGEWIGVRATHVQLLASAVAEPAIAGRSAVPSSRAADDSVPSWLERAVRAGGFVDGYLTARVDGSDRSRLRVALADDTSLTTLAEFHAPIEVEPGSEHSVARELVLRLALTEAALPYFNVAAPDDRTQRTVLLAGVHAALVPPALPGARTPGARLLAVSHPGGGARAPATVSIPADVRTAQNRGVVTRGVYATIGARAGRSRGTGMGLTGRRVIYAAAPVPGTPWVLVREREVDELLGLVRPSFYLTDAIFSVLTLSVLSLLVLWWRAQYQRRVTDSERLRAAFVTGISHELRTPLTQVRMYAEMLRHDLLVSPDERRRALSVIESEAERLSLLIDRTLTFVRTGKAAESLPHDVVDITAAVQRARDALAAPASERQVRWHVDIPVGLALRGVRDDLHRVLLNLFDNAIKYGPIGQCLTIAAAPVPASTNATSSMIAVTITDEGPGIADAEARAIWEPFCRGVAAEQGDTMGTGIGLTVVRDLVERAGGRVYVRAPEGTRGHSRAGATFVVELPAA